jgi:hypothetical protein
LFLHQFISAILSKIKMFNKSSSVLFMLFAVLFTLTSAIVINPTITSPKAGDKWRSGGDFTVTWDTTYNDGTKDVAIPEGTMGRIMLGYLEKGDQYNEHLQWTLKTEVHLSTGSQKITLPSGLSTKTSYIIVLMGDSGNASPQFTIRAGK